MHGDPRQGRGSRNFDCPSGYALSPFAIASNPKADTLDGLSALSGCLLLPDPRNIRLVI